MLRLKSDKHRIGSSTLASCPGPSGSPKLPPSRRLSNESADVSSANGVDPFTCMYADNKPVLLGDDKELHDPHFVRHNWEMMSGDASPMDARSHSPWNNQRSRRSTVSSRASSSRPSSRSGSDAGNSLAVGLGTFSGLSGMTSPNRRRSTQPAFMSGLQVAGSILRDEEAMLDDDSSSSDDEEEESSSRFNYPRRPSMLAQAGGSRSDYAPRRRNATVFHKEVSQPVWDATGWSRSVLMKDRSLSGPA